MNKIGIIGAGPIGLTLAVHFKNAGHDVTVCDVSPEIVSKLRNDKIKIYGIREYEEKIDKVITSIDEFANDKPEFLFVAVKATALPLISSAIQEFHDDNMTVISWQNGIDTEKVLADTLGEKTVLRGVINQGVACPKLGEIFMAFENPPHFVQELDPDSSDRAVKVAELLTSSGLKTERSDNLIQVVWSKTILNAASNALCALSGMTLKENMTDPYALKLSENIVKESVAVARANEIFIGWNYFRKSMNLLKSLGEHKPSMLLDIEAGKRTEIDFINGKIKEFGEFAGIPTPYNDSVIALIKAKERVLLKKR